MPLHPTTVLAREIVEGDQIVTGGGRPNMHVIEVDHHSNVNGLIIFRTAYRADAKPTGSTVVQRDRRYTVLR
jgi:hypothetical protein